MIEHLDSVVETGTPYVHLDQTIGNEDSGKETRYKHAGVSLLAGIQRSLVGAFLKHDGKGFELFGVYYLI